MAFTQDELQSLHTIMEQRLTIHRRELERTFQQQLHLCKRDFEQRLQTSQQEIIRQVSQRMTDQQSRTGEIMAQTFSISQQRMLQALRQELALYDQQSPAQRATEEVSVAYSEDGQALLGEIELQTEISWDELNGLIERSLDERFTELKAALLTTIKDVEHYLTLQIHHLRSTLLQEGALNRSQGELTVGDARNMTHNLEQLEQLVESLQMAMNANHSLLSNRLYHHQQLPFERAHPSMFSVHVTTPQGSKETEYAAPLVGEDEDPGQ